MPKNITDFLNNKELIAYVEERPAQPTLGEDLFPSRKIEGKNFEVVKGASRLPIAASVRAYDSEAEIGGREGFETLKAELVPVSKKIRLDEEDLTKLRTPRTQTEADQVLEEVFDDVGKMVEAVQTRAEAMRFEAMTTGQIRLEGNNYEGTVEYGVPEEQNIVVDTPFVNEETDVLGLIEEWADLVEANSGNRPTRALTSRRVARVIANHPTVQAAIHGNAGVGRRVSLSRLNDYLAEEGLPVIAVEEGNYRVETATGFETHRYIPEDVFVLLPDGELGETIWGTSSYERKLQDQDKVSVEGNIVAYTWETVDPVGQWTLAEGLPLPSFPVADQVFIATGLLEESEDTTPPAGEGGDEVEGA